MGILSDFEIISGSNVKGSGVLLFRQPTLRDIRTIGYDKYLEYIRIINFDPKENLDQVLDIAESISKLGTFILLILDEKIREVLQEALSFFICQPIVYSEVNRCFEVIKVIIDEQTGEIHNKAIGEINNNNFAEVQEVISEIVGGAPKKTDSKNLKFQSKKAQEIYEKAQARRKEFEEAKKSSAPSSNEYSLANIISAVSAKHPSINLTNVWDLTILQLYDQFYRLNIISSETIGSLRWAAWGSESVDFTAWFKELNLK